MSVDVFREFRTRFTIYEMIAEFGMLEHPPSPGQRACLSPLRDERSPSFSIYDDGQKAKDHGGDFQGDAVDLVMAHTGWDWKQMRAWCMQKLGMGSENGALSYRAPREAKKPRPKDLPKVIKWPCELLKGTPETWKRFAGLRGLSYYPGVSAMVEEAGVLRFGVVNGHKCFVVMDRAQRCSEIRRVDGKPFGATKAYPLSGVDKSWLVGAERIEQSTDWAICEGATDFLHLFDLYLQYQRAGGLHAFTPMALLGSKCQALAPDILSKARGRRAVLIPDGDEAGEQMHASWSKLLSSAGADVETIKLPPGKDLRDLALSNQINPEDIFS